MGLSDIISNAGSKAFETTKSVGGKAMEGTVLAKVSEINAIAEHCKQLKSWVEEEQEKHEMALNEAIRYYSMQCDTIAEREKVVQQYKLFCNEHLSRMKLDGHRHDLSVKHDVSINTVNVAGSSIVAGAAAGAAVGGGAAGLMAAFGAASTGTAISALSGSAFTHALLAAFGGGSIASGGLGIAGGTVVLGSLVAIPALVVGGYIAKEKINEVYPKAKECEAAAKETEETCKKIFATYDLAISYLHTINDNFEEFRKNIFSKIIALSPVAANNDSIRENYDALLEKSRNLAFHFMSVTLVDENNEVSDGIAVTIKELEEGMAECKLSYSNLHSSLAEPEQEFISQMPHVNSENWEELYEEMRKKSEKLEKENTQLKKENVEKETIIVNQDLIIKEQDTKISSYENLQKKWMNEKEDLLKRLDAASSEKEQYEAENLYLKKINEDLMESMPDDYEAHCQKMRNKFPNIENDNVIAFLATGEWSYETYQGKKYGDCSMIVLEYVKAVESLLKDVLVYKKLLKKSMYHKMMFGKLIDDYIDSRQSNIKWNHNFSDDLNRIREIRNPAAHTKVVEEEKMEEVRRIAMGKEKASTPSNGVIAYMDKMLKK